MKKIIYLFSLFMILVACKNIRTTGIVVDKDSINYAEINVFQTKNDTLNIYPRKIKKSNLSLLISELENATLTSKDGNCNEFVVLFRFKNGKEMTLFTKDNKIQIDDKCYSIKDSFYILKLWDSAKPECPQKHYDNIIAISYGMPCGNPAWRRKVKNGDIKLGGCEVDSMRWHCKIHNIDF